MNRLLMVFVLLAGVVVGSGLTYWHLTRDAEFAQAGGTDGEREILYYRNPMDSSITSPEFRQDHMGMDYIPVYADEQDAEGEPGMVRIRTAVLQNLNVRTAKAERGKLEHRVEAFGLVDYDEAGLSHVHLRTEGWIEDLRVRTRGETVRKGQLLFRLYSPTLINAQEELLQVARRGTGLDLARDRLRALGMATDEIADVERTGQVRRLVSVRAAHDGEVQELQIREGMFVAPSLAIMTVADLSRIWILTDLFEQQAALVTVGQSARVTLPLGPAGDLEGRVDYIYPALALPTRTVRARLVLDNPGGQLKPGMYARVRFDVPSMDDAVHVPAEAVIRTGRQDRVIVDRGEGRFQAREVRLGRRAGERFEILEGVDDGERVVVSGQFLIDSESSVVAELGRMDAQGEQDEPRELMVKGVVNAVDPGMGVINLSHEPIPELNWPEMTMDFELDSTLDLEGIGPGTKVVFHMMIPEPGVYRVTAVEAENGAKAVPDTDDWAQAEVLRVDPEARRIHLSHGPIRNLGMPGMTMTFQIADGVDLDGIEPGMQIRFLAGEAETSGFEVTAIEPRAQRSPEGSRHD